MLALPLCFPPSIHAVSPFSPFSQWRGVRDEELEAAARAHTGPLAQRPPIYSAIKVDGTRLYDIARNGTPAAAAAVALAPRPVTISTFTLRRQSPAHQDVDFFVRCSKGTYIRSLVSDVGDVLGCGAHLVALRREASGACSVTDAWGAEALIDAVWGQVALSNPVAAAAEMRRRQRPPPPARPGTPEEGTLNQARLKLRAGPNGTPDYS